MTTIPPAQAEAEAQTSKWKQFTPARVSAVYAANRAKYEKNEKSAS